MIAAALCAICYGVGTALQARGATAGPLINVLRRWPFLLGVVLDVLGFVAQLVAVRELPLFVVQAAQAGSLAVTAIASVPLLGIRLAARQWLAVVAACSGLAMLGASSGSEGRTTFDTRTGLLLLAAAVILGIAALIATRVKPPTGPVVQGLVAGLGFGVTALAVRTLPSWNLGQLVHEPAAYAAAISGTCAFITFALGLQRAVTTVAALVVVGETSVPAGIGIIFWHDHTRPGWAVPAVVGFALAVTGALALSRFAEPLPVER